MHSVAGKLVLLMNKKPRRTRGTPYRIGLTALLSEANNGLRERRAVHDPGQVLIDAAVAIADGAVTISDIQALVDHAGLHGPAGKVASTPTSGGSCQRSAASRKPVAACSPGSGWPGPRRVIGPGPPAVSSLAPSSRGRGPPARSSVRS